MTRRRHRAELPALERDEQVARWVELVEARQVSIQVVSQPQGGRPESGIKAASRELGINREDARRAVKVAAIAPEGGEYPFGAIVAMVDRTAADRQRRRRARLRETPWMVVLSVEVDEVALVDVLERRGLLALGQDHDRAAIAEAVGRLLAREIEAEAAAARHA